MLKNNYKNILPCMVFEHRHTDGGLTLCVATVVTEENAKDIIEQITDMVFDKNSEFSGSIVACVEDFTDPLAGEYCLGKRGIHITRAIYDEYHYSSGAMPTFVPYGDILIESRGNYDCSLGEFVKPFHGMCEYESVTLDQYREYLKCGDYVTAKILIDDLQNAISSLKDDVVI